MALNGKLVSTHLLSILLNPIAVAPWQIECKLFDIKLRSIPKSSIYGDDYWPIKYFGKSLLAINKLKWRIQWFKTSNFICSIGGIHFVFETICLTKIITQTHWKRRMKPHQEITINFVGFFLCSFDFQQFR